MKVMIFLAIIFIAQSCKGQNCNCDAFLIPDEGKIPLYVNANSPEILYEINNDTLTEVFYNLTILETKGNFLNVVPTSINDTLKKAAWIENKYVGIYSAKYNSTLNLYAEANVKSKIMFKIKEYFTEPLNIISCSGNWLYVSVTLKNKVYKGWMAPEDQCANVYSTCN